MGKATQTHCLSALPRPCSSSGNCRLWGIDTLRLRQDGHHFADDTFNRIFVNENIRISIKFSLKFVPKVPINNIPALVQIMAWRRPGDKPLSQPMMVRLPTHICVTQPQWVNTLRPRQDGHHFANNVFKCIFLNENVWILLKISLEFVPKVPINNIPALAKIMACADQVTSHYLNQWWLVCQRSYMRP